MAKAWLLQYRQQIKRLGKEKANWTVRWRENGRQRYKTFPNKAEAKRFRDEKDTEAHQKCGAVSPAESRGLTQQEAYSFHGVTRYLLLTWEREHLVSAWEEYRLCGDRVLKMKVWDKAQVATQASKQKIVPNAMNLPERLKAAIHFLKSFLAGGPRLGKDVKVAAKANGISTKNKNAGGLWGARRALGVTRSLHGPRGQSFWWWRLPKHKDNRWQIAVDFLERLLANGPVASEMVTSAANKANISDAHLTQARNHLNVTSKRYGDLFTEPWYWCLPGQQPSAPNRPLSKYEWWTKWHNEEMSYEQIRRKWEKESGESVTRDAIIKGIKRLAESKKTVRILA